MVDIKLFVNLGLCTNYNGVAPICSELTQYGSMELHWFPKGLDFPWQLVRKLLCFTEGSCNIINDGLAEIPDVLILGPWWVSTGGAHGNCLAF